MITNHCFKYQKLALVISLLCGLPSVSVLAQEGEAEEEEAVDLGTYTTEGAVEDTMGLMPTEPVESVFGFGKTLLETPRGATSVSAEMMESFNITDIDDLVLVSPGSFTQSFFGVAGSLDVRGTPGEVYFRGVRRVNNPGNYPTPIGATDRIDIVRGPASPIYGPSKIGGYLNFQPKSARAETGQYLSEPTGRLSITRGKWDKNILTAEVGGPATIGGKSLGYYVYAETENSGSYYDNTSTDQNILQASFNIDLNDKTRFEFGGMFHEFDGNQVAGWNRLTQDLIDNGTYITGTAQSVDTNDDGFNSPDEFQAWTETFTNPNNFFVPASAATDADLDPAWDLENTGTTKLKGNQVLVAPEDQLVTTVETAYFDVIHNVNGNMKLTNKTFYEKLDNINENAYGFAQQINTWVIENQTILSFDANHADWLKGSYQISPSIRYTDFQQGDQFSYEFFDRRDLSKKIVSDKNLLATVTGEDFDNFLDGSHTNYGLALLTDYAIGDSLDILLGARYDVVDFDTDVIVEKVRTPPPEDLQSVSDTDEGFSWTASVSYELPFGLTPYVTLSEQATIIQGQGSEVAPGLIADGNALADSELEEVGFKGSFFNDRLYTAGAYFKQTRTNFSAQDLVSNNTTESEGYELEARFLVTSNFTLTAAYTNVEIINLTALENGVQFGFQGAEDLTGVTDPSQFFGFVAQGLTLVDTESDAKKAGIPENLYSFTGAYEFLDNYRVTASVTHADSTFSGFSKSVKLPSYTLVNAGFNYSGDQWSLGFQVKNLTDETYFRANFPDLFGGTIVLPELPRHYSMELSYSF